MYGLLDEPGPGKSSPQLSVQWFGGDGWGDALRGLHRDDLPGVPPGYGLFDPFDVLELA